jgi:hypothetical protein
MSTSTALISAIAIRPTSIKVLPVLMEEIGRDRMLGIQGRFVQTLVFLPAIGPQWGRNSQMDMVQIGISQQG